MKNHKIFFYLLISSYTICLVSALDSTLISDPWSKCERKCSERFGYQTKKFNYSEGRNCYDGNLKYFFACILSIFIIIFKANYCKGFGEYTGIYNQWNLLASCDRTITNKYYERKCLPTEKSKLMKKYHHKCTDLSEYGEKKIQWYANRKLNNLNCFDKDCSLFLKSL